jgi:hypothetical protein
MCFTTGYPLSKGTFDYWEINVAPPVSFEDYVRDFVAKNLDDYVGGLNFELIDKAIIEAHPRIAIQWIDIYGDTFVRALHSFYESGQWDYTDENNRGYSVVAFAPPAHYPLPPSDILDSWMNAEGISYMELPSYNDDGGINMYGSGIPAGGMRLATINANEIEPALAVRREVLEWYLGVRARGQKAAGIA